MKQRIFSYTLILFFLPLYAQANTKDFDEVCQYFSTLSQHPQLEQMSHLARNDFITQQINDNLSRFSNAKASWQAVSSADPSQRYELFRSAAESVLNKSWQCPIMEKLAPTTGQFE